MSLRPTGHHILVKPDAQPDTSGVIILPQDHDHIPMSGTVVALGPGGSLVRYQARQRAIKDCIEVVESAVRMFTPTAALRVVLEEVAGLIGTSAPEREMQVGDRVAFAAESGLSFSEDGESYIILNEDDVVVVVGEEVAA